MGKTPGISIWNNILALSLISFFFAGINIIFCGKYKMFLALESQCIAEL